MNNRFDNTRLNRQAIRFLLDHRLGRVVTTDPGTGEMIVTPVRYVSDPNGAFITSLASGSRHAEAIRRGGRTMLSVATPHAARPHPSQWVDSLGDPTTEAIWHVQAAVEVETITQRDELERLLSRYVATLSQTPVPLNVTGPGAEASSGSLIGLRLHPVNLTARLHEPSLAVA